MCLRLVAILEKKYDNHMLPQSISVFLCFLFPASVSHVLAQWNIQYTFIGNKLRDGCKPYGIWRFICKALASKLPPDHTILAMFFQSSRIRKVTTDFLDGKHMNTSSDLE